MSSKPVAALIGSGSVSPNPRRSGATQWKSLARAAMVEFQNTEDDRLPWMSNTTGAALSPAVRTATSMAGVGTRRVADADPERPDCSEAVIRLTQRNR